MRPSEIGKAYDGMVSAWDKDMRDSRHGINYLDAAIAACDGRSLALDVGCGTGGRMIDQLLAAGFKVVAVDVSERMLEVARARHPAVQFIYADIVEWQSAERFDLILAWDSTFHLPIDEQEPVLRKLCRQLKSGGVLIFTAGGVRGERGGTMNGQALTYSSLSDLESFEILRSEGSTVLRFERDQFPEDHTVTIAVRRASGE